MTSNFSVNFGRMPVALQAALMLALGDAGLLEGEDVLHDDDVAFHALDLGDVRDPAGAVLACATGAR